VSNSAQESENIRLTEKIAQLEKRIEELENQVRDLNSYVFGTSQERYGIFAGFESEPIKAEPPPKRRGRPPEIAREEMARRRDYLVEFIEVRWPDLVGEMTREATLEGLLATIKRVCPGAESTEGYIKMTEHIGDLWEFLTSGRYQGEPRQIAYALAGRPEIAWRTSFDYCTKNPSELPICPDAFLDHVRRHNPDCFHDLSDNGVTEENRKLLRRCCEECRRVAEQPEWITRALQAGKPLFSSS